MNHSEIVSFLWSVADLIRDTFKRGKYQDITLPLTVLRRLDCVLAPTKEKVLRKQAELRDKKLENLDPQLRKVSGFAFYNTSRYDFEKLLADAPHLAANLRTEPELRARGADGRPARRLFGRCVDVPFRSRWQPRRIL
jgi:type I restriction enzyme M protein